ncbi:MAG: RhuM family protein [Coriobacteriaceae bacterium]|nr:RhuM family protein [Coriobacteriaceae bacterium]
MANTNEIVLFTSSDGEISLPVTIDATEETIWLTRNDMSMLFDRDVKTIGKHINNALSEELSDCRDAVVANFATTASDGKCYRVDHYNLDVIISVGYRVKSQRGVEFRRWATGVLRQFILRGHVESEQRLRQLGTVVDVIERIPGDVGSRELLDIVESYTNVFELLDAYDRESIKRPTGTSSTFELDYDECMSLIRQMRGRFHSDLFGREKDDSFRSSIAVIYQSFGGQDLYPSAEEKAANLLYLIIKNHSFSDGNKRIACSLFLYFLDRNGILFRGLDKRIADDTLVAVALMIAESRPEEKESMIALVMNFLA